jgi:DNA-binding transcriptional LysR family regulator
MYVFDYSCFHKLRFLLVKLSGRFIRCASAGVLIDKTWDVIDFSWGRMRLRMAMRRIGRLRRLRTNRPDQSDQSDQTKKLVALCFPLLPRRSLLATLAGKSPNAMNIHHLELFYYAARHGGIAEAVCNMPYGIQQPAVSSQIAQLEEHLGVTLFQRRPFALSPPGQKLFDFIRPFFSNLETIEAELQGGQALRLGGSTIVLRDFFPRILQVLRNKFPALKLGLREGHQPVLEGLLRKGEIDLAITLLESKSGAGIQSLPLLELPLVLLAPKEGKITEAAQLWRRDKISETLICLPAEEMVSRNFQQGLSKVGVDWFPGIETSALDLIAAYVAGGFGLGVSVAVPQISFPPKVRAVALPDFPPVVIGALWRGKAGPLLQACLDEFQSRARDLSSSSANPKA